MKLITPDGIASHPHLTRPDVYKKSENYKCKLIIDPNEGSSFISKVEKFVEKSRLAAITRIEADLSDLDPKAKNPKLKEKYEGLKSLLDSVVAGKFRSPLADEWVGDDQTGNVVLTTKSKASFIKTHSDGTKETISLAPRFYDAKGTPMTSRPLIKGGAKLSLGITLVPYLSPAPIGGGVTARINSVQILSLVSDEEPSFKARDEGFDASEYTEVEVVEDPTVSNEGVDADEDSIDY